MSKLIWIHEDALRLSHPVFASSDHEAFFVWDEEYFIHMNYAFPRLVFIYETLCEMGVNVYKGKALDVITQLAKQHDSNSIYIPFTPNPRLQSVMGKLEDGGLHIEVVPDEPFIILEQKPNLKRFFRYWNKARKLALLHGGGLHASKD